MSDVNRVDHAAVPVPPDVRLVATDLDGTLLLPDGEVGRRTLDALGALRETDVHLVVITGRPPRWIAPIVAMTGHNGLGVSANGAVVLDLADGRVTDVFTIAPHVALDAVERLRAAIPGVVFASERCAVGHRIRHADAMVGLAASDADLSSFALGLGYRPRWEPPPGARVAPIEEIVSDGDTVKLLARPDPDRRNRLDADEFLALGHAALAGIVEVTHSNVDDVLLEVSAPGVSKGSTLQWVARSLSIGAAAVVAVGDAPNDLPMLEWAGTAYAVANAHPHVRDLADHLLPSNAHEGVATLLEAVAAQARARTSRPPR